MITDEEVKPCEPRIGLWISSLYLKSADQNVHETRSPDRENGRATRSAGALRRVPGYRRILDPRGLLGQHFGGLSGIHAAFRLASLQSHVSPHVLTRSQQSH